MNQHSVLPIHQQAGALAPISPNTTLYQHQDGKTYLVYQQANGQINFVPLDASVQYLAPAQPTQPASRHDPLATVLAALGTMLLIVFLAWFIGFLAGRSGRETVMVPRSPICNTRRSSFLFWSHEERECQ